MIHQFKLATMLLQLEGVATTQALEVVNTKTIGFPSRAQFK